MKKINIKSNSRKYDVLISNTLEEVLQEYKISTNNYVLFIDSKIPDYFVNAISAHFETKTVYKIEGGEDAKTLFSYENVIKFLIDNNINKSDILIACGGGTITDLIGYVASTYKRGVSYISIPSTTLCMIDACIGGKTALNYGSLKNCIGTFYPPVDILIGLDILETLDEKNYKNGLYEALKMGIISNKKIFDIFVNGQENKNLSQLIELSLKSKKKIIEEDEFENSKRLYLNFGHTIGHAIELTTSLLHGEAVANGIYFVAKNSSYFSQLDSILKRMKCTLIQFDNKDSIIGLIANDKKAANGVINLVYCDQIGRPYIKQLLINELKEMI